MQRHKIALSDYKVIAEVSTFEIEGKVTERHVILHVASGEDDQMSKLQAAEAFLLRTELHGLNVIARRYFMREPSGYADAIGQRPLDGSIVAEWLYLKSCDNNHNGYEHLWDFGYTSTQGDSEQQSADILTAYEQHLSERGATIEHDCVRTWFYVHDIDNNYAGLVKARRENFIEQGLTPETHYIASTGICGTPSVDGALVQLDAYAVKGLERGQISYLKAPEYLNPTYEYGVTFERGTAIQYGDRRHILISGTASIDNKGEVLHVGDVQAQTYRMWENVEALLAEAGADFNDVMQIFVYLRNEDDYPIVSSLFAKKFPDMPYVITLAPVCRPTWLIEMECIAVTKHSDPSFRSI